MSLCRHGDDPDVCISCAMLASRPSKREPTGEQPAQGEPRCSCESPHAPHTFGGRPMQYCVGVEPEWRKCPQCKRENSVETWNKNGGKCPNCQDLHDREAGPVEGISAEQLWPEWIKTTAGKLSYRNDPMKVCRLKFAEAYAALKVREAATRAAREIYYQRGRSAEWSIELLEKIIRGQ